MNKYDLIVIGGGTSGVAAAYISAKLGIKTLLVEKEIHLGGTMTSALVTPVMKTNMQNINTEFYSDLVNYAKTYGAQHTYIDSNQGWFNPELLKIVFDKMINDVKCDVIFNTEFRDAKFTKDKAFQIDLESNMLSIQYETKYIVDSTGFGFVSKKLGCDFLESESLSQATTLRFIMSNVNMKIFEEWLLKHDTNRNITTSDHSSSQIHLSTAYTWDTKTEWALRPLFKKAVEDKILEEEDTAYFQIFTVPAMPSSIAFNCPRIILENEHDINDPIIFSKAVTQGRERIYRLSNFCRSYLPGFEQSYISNIADMLGIRESGRVEGKYIFSEYDIQDKPKFENIAVSTDYPIDVHSKDKNSSTLHFTSGNYFLPIESLISSKYDNLFIIGRHLSASFKAQAALRTQSSCFSMGEAVAKYIKSQLV